MKCDGCDYYKLQIMFDTDRGICRGWGCVKDLEPETCDDEGEEE